MPERTNLHLNQQLIRNLGDLSPATTDLMLQEVRRIYASVDLTWWRDTNAAVLGA